ncbi:unnamed protein product [Effrenium voratum]|uniref:Uncharacterized protein n=1 Tax=Effrenium voratum TaxID=2562239 RepID=A0AA36JI39_9DINO|nr:unnamed protein product [Effrenium voratum]
MRIPCAQIFFAGLPHSCQVVLNDGHEDRRRLRLHLAQRRNPKLATPAGHKDGVAVSRLMIWMNQVKHMYSTESLRWLVILGDDVYINLARLFYFLAGHKSRDGHPVMFAHVYDFDMPCPNSATILSRAALEQLSVHASCKTCPYTGSNSISLAYCALYTAVPLVHVPGFHCHDSEPTAEADLLGNHWIAAGGLSMSKGERSHPFEQDFPNLACSLPSTAEWTFQQLAERIRFCEEAAPASLGSPDHDSPLSPETVDAYFEARWPGSSDMVEEVSLNAASVQVRDGRWYFLRQNAWLHHTAVGNFLKEMQRLPDPGDIAFGFLQSGELLLQPGLLVSSSAMRKIQGKELTAASLRSLGIRLVHNPLMVPRAQLLPRTLIGAVSEGSLSGAWAIGDIEEDQIYQDLQMKAEDRRFFAGLLQENFEDLTQEDCSAESLRKAQDWQRFLHNDDEHIKVVRGFQSGRREFRTLHAMYRSEASDALPLRGVLQDTVLVARNCEE